MNVKGTNGRDVLKGTVYSDKIVGKGGADVLVGGRGADVMKGGKGADIFVISDGDTILDFKPGLDKMIIEQPFNQIALIGEDIYTHDPADHSILVPIATTIGVHADGDDFLNI